MKNLTKLDLSLNELNQIEEKTFSGLISLQYLNLTENTIDLIKDNSFVDLPKNTIVKFCESKNKFSYE